MIPVAPAATGGLGITPSLAGLRLGAHAPLPRRVASTAGRVPDSESESDDEDMPLSSRTATLAPGADREWPYPTAPTPAPTPAPPPAPAPDPVRAVKETAEEKAERVRLRELEHAKTVAQADAFRANAKVEGAQLKKERAEGEAKVATAKEMAADAKRVLAEAKEQDKAAKAQQKKEDKEAKEADKALKDAEKATETARKAGEKAELKRQREEDLVNAKETAVKEKADAKRAKVDAAAAAAEVVAAAAEAEKKRKEEVKQAAELIKTNNKLAALAKKNATQAALNQKNAEKNAKLAAAAAAKAEKEAAEKAKELQEEEDAHHTRCMDLERSIHHMRWELRSMSDDYSNMLKIWEDENCDEVLHKEQEMPVWMVDLSSIIQEMQESIQDLETSDPEGWEMGPEGLHQQYANEFNRENDTEIYKVETGGNQIAEFGRAMEAEKSQGKITNQAEMGGDVPLDDDVQIDLRVRVANTSDKTKQQAAWRAEVIDIDLENARPVFNQVDDHDDKSVAGGYDAATGRLATKMEIVANPNQRGYPDYIPQEFSDAMAREVKAMQLGMRRILAGLYKLSDLESVLESVTAHAEDSRDALKVPSYETIWNVQFSLPETDPDGNSSVEAAGDLVKAIMNVKFDVWLDLTGLHVNNVAGITDLASFKAGVEKIAYMKKNGLVPTEDERIDLELNAPGWEDGVNGPILRPDDLAQLLEQIRQARADEGMAEAAARGAQDKANSAMDTSDASRRDFITASKNSK